LDAKQPVVTAALVTMGVWAQARVVAATVSRPCHLTARPSSSRRRRPSTLSSHRTIAHPVRCRAVPHRHARS